MTGLSSALTSALSGLMVNSGQSATVSRNVSRAGEENYTRKELHLTTSADGNVRVATVLRNSEKGLLDTYLASTANSSGEDAILAALERLSSTVGDTDQDGSIAWGLGQLQQSLLNLETDPANTNLSNLAITTANELALSLNEATELVQDVRSQADAGMASSVKAINDLLLRLEKISIDVVQRTGGDEAVVESLDQRDAILKDLSKEIGIRVVSRPNNGMAVYTDSGVTLFDVRARAVTFSPITNYGAGTSGNAVFADGVQITGTGAMMPVVSGNLIGLAKVRDEVAPTYQAQLDEVARGLITNFAETDQQVVPTGPNATGLFTYFGAPAVPTSGTMIVGLAAEISIAAAFDPRQGGTSTLLRDGGANGANYVYNATAAPGFQDRISSLISSFDGAMTFDTASELVSSSSLLQFAANSAGWVEDLRASSQGKSDNAAALVSRAKDALMRKSGVNIDEEMATLLDLEKSYQAAAKVMSTVGQMYTTLMDIVR